MSSAADAGKTRKVKKVIKTSKREGGGDVTEETTITTTTSSSSSTEISSSTGSKRITKKHEMNGDQRYSNFAQPLSKSLLRHAVKGLRLIPFSRPSQSSGSFSSFGLWRREVSDVYRSFSPAVPICLRGEKRFCSRSRGECTFILLRRRVVRVYGPRIRRRRRRRLHLHRRRCRRRRRRLRRRPPL
jgi:hypothetical protein